MGAHTPSANREPPTVSPAERRAARLASRALTVLVLIGAARLIGALVNGTRW